MPKGKPKSSWLMARCSEMLKENATAGAFTTGRAAARAGRVRRFKVDPGQASGVVMIEHSLYSSQPRLATASVPLYDLNTWERIIERLRGDMALVLRMVGGSLPAELEPLVTEAGVELLPRLGEMALSCSYDGNIVLCSHTVALVFSLALAAERYPFVLFTLRGRSKAELFTALGFDSEPDTPPPNPLPSDYRDFWRLDAPFVALEASAAPFERKPATLMQLSLAQLTLSGDLGDQLLPLYQRVSEEAMKANYEL